MVRSLLLNIIEYIDRFKVFLIISIAFILAYWIGQHISKGIYISILIVILLLCLYKKIEFLLPLALFADAQFGGLIPMKYLSFYSTIHKGEFFFIVLLFYSILHFEEIKPYFNHIITKIILIWVLYVIFQIIVSSARYDEPLIAIFARTRHTLKILYFIPFLFLNTEEKITKFIKISLIFMSLVVIMYVGVTLLKIPISSTYYVVQEKEFGGIPMRRVYANIAYTPILGFFFLAKALTRPGIRSKTILYLLFSLFFLVPILLAFGRGSWLNNIFAISLIFFFSLKKYGNKEVTTKFVNLGILVVLFFIVLNILGRIGFENPSDLFHAMKARFTSSVSDFQSTSGTYEIRVEDELPVLFETIAKNPILGIGLDPGWQAVRRPSMLTRAIADIRPLAQIVIWGIPGIVIIIISTIVFVKFSLQKLKIATDNTWCLLLAVFIHYIKGAATFFFFPGIITYWGALLVTLPSEEIKDSQNNSSDKNV